MNALQKLQRIIDSLEEIRDDMQREKVTKRKLQEIQDIIKGLKLTRCDMQRESFRMAFGRLRSIIKGLEEIRDDMQRKEVTKRKLQKLQRIIDSLEEIRKNMWRNVLKEFFHEMDREKEYFTD